MRSMSRKLFGGRWISISATKSGPMSTVTSDIGSAAPEECDRQLVELGLVLDLGPVSAPREHVESGIRHATQGEEGVVEWEHAVVAAPRHEHLVADLVQRPPELIVLAWPAERVDGPLAAGDDLGVLGD